MTEKASTKPPKGTRDFLPEDIRRREHVTRVIREVYEAHGFQPLETPTFERLDTLLGKYGEEGDQLVFKVLHRGQPLVDGIRRASALLAEEGAIVVGRSGETAPAAERLLADMGLRYDLTVPLARVFAEYQGRLGAVFKRYQIQPVWRADSPGKGRFREFYQCDVDVVGSPSLAVEVELLGAASLALERLGFGDFEIRINHRGLLRALIESAGIDPKKETDAIIAIDKLDKVGAEGVEAELRARDVDEKAIRTLITILRSMHRDELRSGLNERGLRALDEIERIIALSSSTRAAHRLRLDLALARGLGYYTGCIFEIGVKDLAGSLGGGGRYDGLVGMFLGKAVPAAGISLGLERILVVMEERNMFPDLRGGIDVSVATADDRWIEDALRLASELRARGLSVDLEPRAMKPGKARKAADERGSRFLALLVDEPGEVALWSRRAPEITDRRVPRAEIANTIESER